MKPQEQRDGLVRAIELALPNLRSPALDQFGEDDCARVHIDLFTGQQMACMTLINAVAEATGEEPNEVFHRVMVRTAA